VSERHVVITGAAQGIGHAMALGFVSAGWRVTRIDVRQAPAPFPLIAADVTDEAALADAFDRASDQQKIDATIANAAVTDLTHKSATDLEYSVWQRIMRVNVDGAFLTARLAARHMRPHRAGNIIFVTSSLAFIGAAQANDAPYCASKAAIEMLKRVMALELEDDGINVNSLFPSVMVDTGFFAHWSDEKRAALARADILNGAALFLAGLQPGALTGVSLDQHRWDNDEAYQRQLRESVRAEPIILP
jgi:NAD(P)-dependent dehydrogenase (short-subunit alcohol dehydrogenase family)